MLVAGKTRRCIVLGLIVYRAQLHFASIRATQNGNHQVELLHNYATQSPDDFDNVHWAFERTQNLFLLSMSVKFTYYTPSSENRGQDADSAGCKTTSALFQCSRIDLHMETTHCRRRLLPLPQSRLVQWQPTQCRGQAAEAAESYGVDTPLLLARTGPPFRPAQ